jgi:NAD-dependent deacetylase
LILCKTLFLPISLVSIIKSNSYIKPEVVLYEEPLNNRDVTRAVQAIQNADLLLVGGTSLSVYPAAGLVRCFTGRRLAVINKDAPPDDIGAALVINGAIGEVLGRMKVTKKP